MSRSLMGVKGLSCQELSQLTFVAPISSQQGVDEKGTFP